MKAEDIIAVIDELAKRFGLAVDWTSDNVLPYIQTLMAKYINYCICTDIVWIVMGIISFIGCKYFAGIGIHNRTRYLHGLAIDKRLDWNKKSDDPDWAYYHNSDDNVYIIPFIIALALFISATLATLPNILHLIKCLTIPEMVMFEYIKSLK